MEMPDSKNEPSRLELYKAGKLEERRGSRQRPPVVAAAEKVETDDGSIHLRPTVIVLALTVLALLVITFIAM